MKKTICISGLGNIGLPTACVLATSGYEVLGVDTNYQVVERLQTGITCSLEPNLQDLLKQVIKERTFTSSLKPTSANIHIIVVPTFLKSNNEPDISCVYEAIKAIKPHLRPKDLVVIESTCPIGTTDILARDLKMNCSGVQVAYCPERVLPGNILHELIHNDRVVGGVDDVSTFHAIDFYQTFVKGEVLATDAKTAETVKLAENSYRDINIAYANELSMIADHLNVNINEVIRLANRHPRVQILKPGAGVGGYCIAINPWFLASSAPKLAQITVKAREVNLQKTGWVIQKIKTVIQEKKARIIACLGLTYKADVSDIRESPALMIAEALEKEIQVLRIDPYVLNTVPLYEALDKAEIIVGLVAHNAFSKIPSALLNGKIVLDFAGIFQ